MAGMVLWSGVLLQICSFVSLVNRCCIFCLVCMYMFSCLEFSMSFLVDLAMRARVSCFFESYFSSLMSVTIWKYSSPTFMHA